MSTIHLRNGRVHQHRGMGLQDNQGKTWCGKKLFGPAENLPGGLEVFTSYGERVEVTLDPEQGNCPHCRSRFDAAYAAAFPNGPQPIATFRLDDPASVAQARAILGADNLARVFGADGGGIAELDEQLRATQAQGEG